MYSLIFVVSSSIGALTFTNPRPPCFPLVYSLRVTELCVKTSMHGEELSCLDIFGLYLWPGFSTSGLCDYRKGMVLMAWIL